MACHPLASQSLFPRIKEFELSNKIKKLTIFMLFWKQQQQQQQCGWEKNNNNINSKNMWPVVVIKWSACSPSN